MNDVMNRKVRGSDAAWDEGSLGDDEAYVAVAPSHIEAAVEESMGMQAVSIRLPREMIAAYKLIAAHHGIGYQPLMRDILQRFIPQGLKEVMETQQNRANEAESRMVEMKKAA